MSQIGLRKLMLKSHGLFPLQPEMGLKWERSHALPVRVPAITSRHCPTHMVFLLLVWIILFRLEQWVLVTRYSLMWSLSPQPRWTITTANPQLTGKFYLTVSLYTTFSFGNSVNRHMLYFRKMRCLFAFWLWGNAYSLFRCQFHTILHSMGNRVFPELLAVD